MAFGPALPGALLAALPWLLAALVVPPLLLRRSPVRRFGRPPAEASPLVSVIVPARNEAENVGACLATLLNSEYPAFEIIVVDDRSTDGTGEIARVVAERSGGRLRVLEGEVPPAGWVGKPWACWQGYHAAQGELLLFTDADTRHDETLLAHAVGGVMASGAELLSVLPRQRMVGFWERVVLPQLFTIISLRFLDVDRVARAGHPRSVIANGQYLLFRREAYERIGGHRAVAGDVVEALGLAQLVAARGGRVLLAHADDLMETRMYRSLAGILDGWTRNLALGSRRTVPPAIAPALPWVAGLLSVLFWVVPPLVLLACLITPLGGIWLQWSALASAAGLALWGGVNLALRQPPQHALFYPLGAAVVAVLFFRSAARGATPPTPP